MALMEALAETRPNERNTVGFLGGRSPADEQRGLSRGDRLGKETAMSSPNFRAVIVLVLASSLVCSFASPAFAASGDLDSSFSGDGKVTTNFTRRADVASGMELQPDGKIVTAGVAGAGGSNPKFALARHNTDGTLDSTFSSDGKVTTDLTPRLDGAHDMTIDGTGRIVAAGVVGIGGSDPRFALVRYNPDGSLDTSFSGDGKVITNFSRHYDSARAVAIDPDGKIVVAGTVNWGPNPNFGVARYNPDGSLDSSFSGDGKVTIDVSGRSDNALEMAIQSDGKIVVSGEGGFGRGRIDSKLILVRLTDAGALDATFSSDGKVMTQFTPRFDGAWGVAVDGDNRIVAVGFAGAWVNKRFALARYSPNGRLDTTFGGDGKVMTDFTRLHDEAIDVSFQQDEKILVGGEAGDRLNRRANSQFALARYNTNGSLDLSFSGNGKLFTNLTRKEDAASRILAQQDEKIVAAGYAAGGATFAIARYLP
jgi:uncharacterized delta-60 repeat protein